MPGHVVIDCCPLLGVLSLNAIFACDLVIIPVSADYLALQGAQQVERSLNALEPVFKHRLPRRYLLTRFDARRKMSSEVADLMAMAFRPGGNLRDAHRGECEPGGEPGAPARRVSARAAKSRRTRLPGAGGRTSGRWTCA